jgi:MFS family permease
LKTNLSGEHKDTFFLRNTIGISVVELFWGLGIPVLIDSTFLQLFLTNMGASSWFIGLVPSVLSLSITVFSVVIAFLTSHMVHKRKALILTHIITGVPLVLYGIILLLTGYNYTYSLLFFLISYILYSLGMGLLMPLWQNYTVAIFSEEKVLPAISVMMICQSVTRLIAGLILIKFVEKYSFSPQGSGIIFSSIGSLFILGTFFFFMTKEIPDIDAHHKPESGLKLMDFIQFNKQILKNKNFVLFLLSGIEYCACTCIIAFYAKYATKYCQINPAIAAGLFVTFIYIAMIFINITFGWFNLFQVKTKMIVSKLTAIIAVVLLLLSCNLTTFLIASFCLGISRGTYMLVYGPAVKKLSGKKDATIHFTFGSIFLFPFSFGLPILSGVFLDSFPAFKGLSYKLLFSIHGILIIISLGLILIMNFDETGNK